MIPLTAIRSFKSSRLWTPNDLTNANTNLRVFLNAANASSISLNGTKVSQWGDLSGNNFHFGQSTSSIQPVYDPINKSINFANNAGGTNYLFRNSSTNELNWTGNQTCTIIAGIKAKANTSTKIVGGFYTGNSPNNDLKSLQIRLNYNSTTLNYTPSISARSSNRQSTYSFSGTTDHNLLIIGEYNTNFNSANTKITINGSNYTAASGSNASLNFNSTLVDPYKFTIIIGGEKDESNNSTLRSGFYGNVEFLAFITGNLLTSDNEKITGWWAHNWNHQSLLPTLHPYKNYPPYA